MNITRQTRREMMKSTARLSLAGVSMGAGFLGSSSLWSKPGPQSRQRFKIGACDWTLGKRSDPAALEMPKRAVKWKVLPWPGALSTQILPPIICRSWREIVSPKPVPPKRRVVEPSAWVKASKMRTCFSAVIPMPVSWTLK